MTQLGYQPPSPPATAHNARIYGGTGPRSGSYPPTGHGAQITLAILVSGLFVAVVLLTVLQINTRAAISDVDRRAAGVERKLSDADEQARDNRSATKALESRHQALLRTNTGLRACTEPARTAISAGAAGDSTGTARALIDMYTNCREVGQS